jgi:hypothetical protein
MKLECFERLSKEGISRGLVMALVKTLAERKRAQVEAIFCGIAGLREDLTEYGRFCSLPDTRATPSCTTAGSIQAFR